MPTGGGKSICYQVPAMKMNGLCLVISPLIALMKDQVENLRKKNITAFAIYSGMQRKEVITTLKVAANSNCKFLYVSPERLETSLFKEYLPALDVNLIAVDEAHCISQWGYDFRPPYLRIAALREELPAVPVLALTASATPEVQSDICEKLSFRQPNIFRQSFERPNISYSVFTVESRINKVFEILKNVPGTSIVYCKSRKRTKEIHNLLQLTGISSDHYHAGLAQQERDQKQQDWINGKTRVIVCTNAFGMGIDKPDVRTVIHMDLPDSLENYYQEAGRAGRDGNRAYAVLLSDANDLEQLTKQSAIRYPDPATVKKMYHDICNYLQLPAGSGANQSFDFDIIDFSSKFETDPYNAMFALKALEQEGWISFNEQAFFPSTIQFIASKERLYEFEKTNPLLESLIKTLLRTYEGIFDHRVPIQENTISRLLSREVQSLKKDLLQLHIHGIIEYIHQKDKPQLIFLHDRVRTEEMHINEVRYNERKKRYESRAEKMIAYVTEQQKCRSQLIGNYFGDEKIKECGICDNCLRKKRQPLSKDEFNKIFSDICEAIPQGKTMPSSKLFEQLGVKKEKALRVLEFMQSENKVEVDGLGVIKRIRN